MDEVLLWHWITIFIQIATPSSIIISYIAWLKNKNPNNKLVKILYLVRFYIGILYIALIIKDFSFLLSRGDKVGIIGSNGCGKTTLIRMLLGELAPDSGSVPILIAILKAS